ncbi:Protein NPGR2 [Bienertia sinuspersici]
MDHPTFALSISGDLGTLARKLEGLPEAIIERKQKYFAQALYYHHQGTDANNSYNLALGNSEQRKLDAAFSYAKQLMRLEVGSETIVNAAVEQTGKWEHAELLRIGFFKFKRKALTLGKGIYSKMVSLSPQAMKLY